MSQRIYGIYMSTPPTLSDGDVHPVLLDERGRIALGANVEVPVGMVIALAETPVPIALTAADATAIYLQAARANGVNTGNVFIGIVADLVSGTKNYITLMPGDTWEY